MSSQVSTSRVGVFASRGLVPRCGPHAHTESLPQKQHGAAGAQEARFRTRATAASLHVPPQGQLLTSWQQQLGVTAESLGTDISQGLALIQEWTGMTAAEARALGARHSARLADGAGVLKLLRQLLLLYHSFGGVRRALLQHEHYRLVRGDAIAEASQYLASLGVPQVALAAVFEAHPELLLGWDRSMQARLTIWALIARHMSSDASSSDATGAGVFASSRSAADTDDAAGASTAVSPAPSNAVRRSVLPPPPWAAAPPGAAAWAPACCAPPAAAGGQRLEMDMLDVLLDLAQVPGSLAQPGSVAELATRLGFMAHRGCAPRRPADAAAPLDDFLASCGEKSGAWLLYRNYAWPQSDVQRRLAQMFGYMLFIGGGGARVAAAPEEY